MSKGGHAHKDFDDDRPFKSMVTFEDISIEVIKIEEIVPEKFLDEEAETGVVFGFTVKTSTWNENHSFKYADEDTRDKALKKFRAKLIALGVNLM